LLSQRFSETARVNTTTASGLSQRDAPAKQSTKAERIGKCLILCFFLPSGFWEVFGFMKGPTTMDEIWNVCNSLRYGFDDEYDSPVFDDEDSSEEEETDE
tara:strand:+ start:655 stop:954 length:300 start_codon:yes stop_codon:yes gene_type:complete